mmetsp:Transcript_47792/g.51659  ORF Transcript_47792/g.51659 Transcript_47792/m.51659 type:complete len:749 (-) Transcript_47792:174-2420(-)
MIGISLLLRHCVLLVMATLLLDATTDRNTCTVNAFKTGLQQQPLPLPLPWSNNRSVRDTVPYFADLTSTVDVADVDEKSTKTLKNTTPMVAVSVTAVTMADADVDVDVDTETKILTKKKTTTTEMNTSGDSSVAARTRTRTRIQRQPPGPYAFPIVGTLFDFFSRGGVDGMCDVHESMYQDYGEIYGMNLASGDVAPGEYNEVVLCDPRMYAQLLKQETRFPVGAASQVTSFVDYYQENNLTVASGSVSNGPDWKEWRQATSPDMSGLWETYLPTIAETCAKISTVAGREVSIEQNMEFGTDFLSRAAFDMFSAVLYGESPHTTNSRLVSPQDLEFVVATQRAFDITGQLMTNPIHKFLKSNLYDQFVLNMDRTFQFATDRTKEYAEDAVEARHQQQQQQQEKELVGSAIPPPTTATTTSSISNDEDNTTRSTGSGGGTSGCPIAAIKAATSSSSSNLRQRTDRQKKKKSIDTQFSNPSFVERLIHREQLSMEEISESIAPLLMAGLDTTAYQMSWFYLHMASSPDIQQKLATDLHTHLGGEDVTTKEQLDSLLYLKACIREAHRLTPTGAMQVKTLPNDIDLVIRSSSSSSDDDDDDDKTQNNKEDNTEYYCTIKAGQRISLNLRGYPMDPNYVEAPQTYQPERFLPEAIAQRKGTMAALALDHPDFADAFGRGKRRCLGANVATAEMMILAARLLQDWKIALVDDNEAIQSPTKTWKPIQKLMLRADPYPSMTLVPRERTPHKSTM